MYLLSGKTRKFELNSLTGVILFFKYLFFQSREV